MSDATRARRTPRPIVQRGHQHAVPLLVWSSVALLLAACVSAAGPQGQHASPRAAKRGDAADASIAADAACRGLVPAAAGGPMPAPPLLAIRWLGTTNFELAYGRTVVLLDAYYGRGPRNRPIGVAAADLTRADVLLVGHAHFDHIADAAAIAKRTGAVVVGAPLSIAVVRRAGVPAGQTRSISGRGGELLRFGDVTVEPVLAQHSVLSTATMAKFRSAIEDVIGVATPEVAAAEEAIQARGTFTPAVLTEGTVGYLLTFGDGFRVFLLDSAGPVTEAVRALMRRIRRTDVAIIAYQGQYLADRQAAVTLPLVKLAAPDVFIPAHHDALLPYFLDLGLEPLFRESVTSYRAGTRSAPPTAAQSACG
jgi:L-ascorbate metabolism protein UlaG (beta-lactamase superfamily)